MSHKAASVPIASSEDVMDVLGFAPSLAMGGAKWDAPIPDTPGVYVILDGNEVIYVGMAGRNGAGSLRRRLRDHASGQVVNMFAQYLLFARLLDGPDRPRTPREAAARCRAYIKSRCKVRVLPLGDPSDARRIEQDLRQRLSPRFNASTALTAPVDPGDNHA